MEGRKTALEIVVEKHEADKKDDRHYCKKWSEKTSGAWKWPEVGTLDEQWCQKMRDRLNIWGEQKKGPKAKAKSIKQERIVGWFEGERKERSEKERMQRE